MPVRLALRRVAGLAGRDFAGASNLELRTEPQQLGIVAGLCRPLTWFGRGLRIAGMVAETGLQIGGALLEGRAVAVSAEQVRQLESGHGVPPNLDRREARRGEHRAVAASGGRSAVVGEVELLGSEAPEVINGALAPPLPEMVQCDLE